MSGQHLSIRVKAFYGLGQALWGVKETTFNYFLIFFYVQNLGLSGSLAGLGALVAIIFDAVSDPMMAHISDHYKSRFGRRHPFILGGVLPFAISIFFLFNPIEQLGQWGLFLWMTFFSILSRLMVTLFSVPHTALAAELSTDYLERASIFGYRIAFGYLGAILLQGVTLFLLLPESLGGTLYTEGYSDVGAFAALVAILSGGLSAWGTWDQIKHLPKAPKSSPPLYTAFIDMVRVFRLANFRYYMAGSIQFQVIIGVAQALILYLLTFYYQFTSAQSGVLVGMVLFGIVPGYALTKWGVARFGKRNAVMLFLFIGSVLGSSHVTLFLYGYLPAAGSDSLFYIVLSIVLLNQCFIIAYVMSQGSMMGDMVDEYSHISGRRQEGLFAAAQTFAQKLTFGLGAAAAGLIIDFVGFDDTMLPGQVGEEALFNFGFIVGPVMFILSLCAIIPYIFYNLDQERLAQLQSTLHDAGDLRV